MHPCVGFFRFSIAFQESKLSFRRMSEILSKMHSILHVVNAHADVERALHESRDVETASQWLSHGTEPLPDNSINCAAHLPFVRNCKTRRLPEDASWGILFGSEYIWTPEIGALLIVCLCEATNFRNSKSDVSTSSTLGNCCILQFKSQLSTCSSLRIIHGN